ncbi:S66 peptidase family protein [Legionella sp. D16C41]|uniref:S66 peptidase family protein n=1 Tax=Legionella sp. D16C41 TaxID=3402688 RepID=UPI003AF63513
MSLFEIGHLTPGDTVDIVAPSSRCHPSVIEKVKVLLLSWGLYAHVPPDLLGENLLYANSDEKRFFHLKNALLNPHSQVIWCLLGGFGATKLLPMLKQIKPTTLKLLIGFSDITALHIFFQGQWGWPTLSGPSAYQVSLNRVSENSVKLLKDILFGNTTLLRYEKLIPLNNLAQDKQIITAPIIGGNLHLIQASLGTFWQPAIANKILFIEEFNERAYRIDRVLAQLEQAGLFRHAKAILFGDMIDKGEPNGQFLVKEVIQEFAAQCTLPVLQISNIGHGPINNPLLLGYLANLYMGDNYCLEFRL